MEIRNWFLLLWEAVLLGATAVVNANAILSDDALRGHIERLRGDDYRLVRYDITEHTEGQQETECKALAGALGMLTTDTQAKETKSITATTKQLICEYATFCITDNPENRDILSQVPNIYRAIVDAIQEAIAEQQEQQQDGSATEFENDEAIAASSASAAHLVYIASFYNPANQQGFFQAGAIDALTDLLHLEYVLAVQQMWATAALQNLAASYCENIYCEWGWEHDDDDETSNEQIRNIQMINTQANPLESDGSPMRQAMLKKPELLTSLVHLLCIGPVIGEQHAEHNPFPGDQASSKDGKHNHHSNLLAWAAAGALKNIALEANGRQILESDGVGLTLDGGSAIVPCACHLQHSEDWLEGDKAEGLLQHLRPTDPCYYIAEDDTNDPENMHHNEEYGEDEGDILCWDAFFVNADGLSCGDMIGGPTHPGCQTVDPVTSVKATEACCECGGGTMEDDDDDFEDEYDMEEAYGEDYDFSRDEGDDGFEEEF